jgi:preprotein translocase subunit YajC
MNESTMSILLIVGLIAIFYFMLIRPQQKRMRQQTELMSNLHTGDDVMTSSGIYGTVSEIEEETVLLEVSEDVEIRVAKNSIVRNFTGHEEPEEEPDETEEPEEETEEPEKEPEEEPEKLEEEPGKLEDPEEQSKGKKLIEKG